MGSKAQRQNQHIKHLERKIRQFKAKELSTEKLEKELGYAKGGARPEFTTGREADPRVKKKTV
jgi:hypothetical protein